MSDPIPLLASQIGSKLVIDDEFLRPAFFDPGSPMEREPLASEMQAIAEGREPTHEGLAGAPRRTSADSRRLGTPMPTSDALSKCSPT